MDRVQARGQGPLAGMRVLELSHVMAGPFCGMQLADMGADVIKIEKLPGGDDIRRSVPPWFNGEPSTFLAVNRNKRGIAVDLKSARGKELFLALVDGADVVLENMRPGAMAKLGLGYEQLKARNPGLIYAALSGFGQTGPYAHRRGFDLVAQGMSGLMSLTGSRGGEPVKVGVPICDLNAGMFTALGILAAYVHKQRTGEGQMVDTSLLEAGIAYTPWESAIYWSDGTVPVPFGTAHRISAPYQAYKTADGGLVLGAANQKNWEKMCHTVGREDLITDERFAGNEGRITRLDELNAELGPAFAKRTTADWLARLEEAGVPAGPINDMAQVWADPHVRARKMLVETEHPRAGAVPNIGVPVKLSETPAAVRHAAPLFGQHTGEVLAEVGVDSDALAALHADGVVYDASCAGDLPRSPAAQEAAGG
jgi:crotonobetainyl-CoA:carnitine CoA-transferase CaiB-like acyl-CoA transferase